MTATSVIIYECGICGHCHPWDWNGDCRDDDNRFASDEYAARLGIPESELDIRSWEDRCEADGLTITCKDCGQQPNDELTADGFCPSCDSDRKWGAGDQRCNKCNGPWRRGRCENCDSALAKFGIKPGDMEIWYAKDGRFMQSWWGRERDDFDLRNYKMGVLQPCLKNIAETHILLGTTNVLEMEKVFAMMQGENWSPNGEANEFIRGLGLSHTTMCQGDVIKFGDLAHVVAMMGFDRIF